MTDSNRAIQALCQRCGKWREAVNRETEWTCRECHLEAQGQRLLAIVEARGRERDAALQLVEEARHVAALLYDGGLTTAERFGLYDQHGWLEEALQKLETS